MGRSTCRGQPVNITNPPKALILLVALVCVTVLMAIGKVPTDAGLPLVSATLFYAIGNGVAAKTGQPVEPIIGKKEPK